MAIINDNGIERQTNPVKAIRRLCLECLGNSSVAVEECTNEPCEVFAFRLGKNPYRTARVLSDEQKDVIARRLHPEKFEQQG